MDNPPPQGAPVPGNADHATGAAPQEPAVEPETLGAAEHSADAGQPSGATITSMPEAPSTDDPTRPAEDNTPEEPAPVGHDTPRPDAAVAPPDTNDLTQPTEVDAPAGPRRDTSRPAATPQAETPDTATQPGTDDRGTSQPAATTDDPTRPETAASPQPQTTTADTTTQPGTEDLTQPAAATTPAEPTPADHNTPQPAAPAAAAHAATTDDPTRPETAASPQPQTATADTTTQPGAEDLTQPAAATTPAEPTPADHNTSQPAATPEAAAAPGTNDLTQPTVGASADLTPTDADTTQTVSEPQVPAVIPGTTATHDPEATPPTGIPAQGSAYQGLNPNWDPATSPIPRIRANDPVAAAVGNASLLGIGYFLMRRIGWAVAAIAVTATLLVLLATTWRTTWFEIVVVVWWVALIAHGWVLAGRRAKRISSARQRITATACAVVVLLVFGLLRWSGEAIDNDIDDARAAGDCAKAQSSIDGIWWAHRVADAPMTVRGEQTNEACTRLATATKELADGLNSGMPVSLDKGFLTLRGVLADLPGHERMVDSVLDGFLRGLPRPDPCGTALVTDWLRQLQPAHDRLDRAKDVLPKVEPKALLGCGNQLLAARSWEPARTRYGQLTERYPGDPGVAEAQKGTATAQLGIEHDTVEGLLTNGEYCARPAKYSAAPTYKKGTNRGYFIGDEDYVGDLPGAWKTTDFTKAALIVCLGDTQSGPVVRTCPYTYNGGASAINVAFHKIAIPVQAYALRTGKKVVDTKIQISGSSCPASFTYTSYSGGPPGEQDIEPTKEGVQLAFKFLVVR